MLNLDFDLRSLNKLDSAGPAHKARGANLGDPFYSVLIKHQLDMIRAWNPPIRTSGVDIDPFSLSTALLKLKGFSTEQNIQPSINSRHAVNSYEAIKQMENGGNLKKPSLKEFSARVATNHSIPAKLFQNLIQTESGYDPKALSPSPHIA